ncbi:putative phosphoglycerate mutase [Ceratocystis fimbriata CBS 114723]|uniref:Putative phosphoglycerate mutase n=1 Tax=Ceratocystis fimbriata CBS 114723 TaxID=1035309 RepID=A0A2C5XA21_9PEZI|nr:putative phosphoglycerate mutase [Ceratocystis fimbriata CBS 114723]
MPHYKFQAVPDIFVDFAPRCAADPSFKVTTQPDLAIIDRSYPGDDEAAAKLQPWERLAAYVKRLNAGAEPGIKYKIVYLTRHGVGDHNAMIRKVGQKEWDDHISKLDSVDGVLLSDARLVQEGIDQAVELSRLWSGFLNHGAPLPQSLYSSPLTRCLQTSKLVFEPLCAARNLPYRPTIKELLRERMTDHTCDRRSSKTYIAETFPEYAIEDGFTETDELWRADRWETLQAHLSRKQTVLEDIFSSDPSESISLAMHSMAVAAVGRVCGMRESRVREGTSHALLVKAVQVDASPSYDEATEGLQGL